MPCTWWPNPGSGERQRAANGNLLDQTAYSLSQQGIWVSFEHPTPRAALTEGDQLMSSPPVWLVSSWAHGRSDFPKKYTFSSPAIKNYIFIGGHLLTLPSLFNFKTCWRGTKVSLTLNTAWMYTLGIVKKTWQRNAVMYVDNVCYVPCVTFVSPTSTSSRFEHFSSSSASLLQCSSHSSSWVVSAALPTPQNHPSLALRTPKILCGNFLKVSTLIWFTCITYIMPYYNR